MRAICAVVCAAFMVCAVQYTTTEAQEKKDPAPKIEAKAPDKGEDFKGSRWILRSDEPTGAKHEGFFQFSKDDGKGNLEGTYLYDRTHMGSWKATYKDGRLRGSMTQRLPKEDTPPEFDFEAGICRDKDNKPIGGIGFGFIWPKDKKEAAGKLGLVNLKMDSAVKREDRLPPKDLAEALKNKKWQVGMVDGNDRYLELKPGEKTVIKGTVRLGDKFVEVEGTIEGTLLALTWKHDPSDAKANRISSLVFFRKDDKWLAFGVKVKETGGVETIIISELVPKKD